MKTFFLSSKMEKKIAVGWFQTSSFGWRQVNNFVSPAVRHL